MFTIKSVEAIALRIPFGDFYAGPRSAPRNWTHFETVLVRVESADGAELAAHLPQTGLVEFLYTRPDAWIGQDIPLPRSGKIAVSRQPGIGFTPDEAVLDRYRLPERHP